MIAVDGQPSQLVKEPVAQKRELLTEQMDETAPSVSLETIPHKIKTVLFSVAEHLYLVETVPSGILCMGHVAGKSLCNASQSCYGCRWEFLSDEQLIFLKVLENHSAAGFVLLAGGMLEGSVKESQCPQVLDGFSQGESECGGYNRVPTKQAKTSGEKKKKEEKSGGVELESRSPAAVYSEIRTYVQSKRVSSPRLSQISAILQGLQANSSLTKGKPVTFSKESFHAALNSQSEEKDKESTELLKGTPLPC
ncbi:hypothetical protein Anapl_03232 [Anas platyrhynchos]|uniref:Uncharacterized protein n=1 Tax=Anas platyrhynchos TaxID=8839 RepID=R0KWF6_ANAPL|nr:hypothetical protein Anapl_03232 [Anas platyrhynchos]